jgi:hypothetical protein
MYSYRDGLPIGSLIRHWRVALAATGRGRGSEQAGGAQEPADKGAGVTSGLLAWAGPTRRDTRGGYAARAGAVKDGLTG